MGSGGGPIRIEMPMEISPACEVAGAAKTAMASSAIINNPDINIPVGRGNLAGKETANFESWFFFIASPQRRFVGRIAREFLNAHFRQAVFQTIVPWNHSLGFCPRRQHSACSIVPVPSVIKAIAGPRVHAFLYRYDNTMSFPNFLVFDEVAHTA